MKTQIYYKYEGNGKIHGFYGTGDEWEAYKASSEKKYRGHIVVIDPETAAAEKTAFEKKEAKKRYRKSRIYIGEIVNAKEKKKGF